jgi:hypothetical protein
LPVPLTTCANPDARGKPHGIVFGRERRHIGEAAVDENRRKRERDDEGRDAGEGSEIFEHLLEHQQRDCRLVPDEKTRNLIFVDNPAELFGFPPVSA